MFQPDPIALRAAMHEWFDPATLARGQVYFSQKRVLTCAVHWEADTGWVITSTVRGSNPQPYLVYLELSQADGQLVIVGFCSCPPKLDCKHAAATLFHVMEKSEIWFQTSAPPALTAWGTAPGQGPPTAPMLQPQWQSWLQHAEQVVPAEQPLLIPGQSDEPDRLLFILKRQPNSVRVDLALSQRLQNGKAGRPRNCSFSSLFFNTYQPKVIHPEDRELAARLLVAQRTFNFGEPILEGPSGAEVIGKLVASGRCYWRSFAKGRAPLVLGPARPAKAAWVVAAGGEQQARFDVQPPATDLLPLEPPWYVDEPAGLCGPLDAGMSPALARAWLTAPPVPPDQAGVVSTELVRRLGVASALPTPEPVELEIVADLKPVPRLRLFAATLKRSAWIYYRNFDEPAEMVVNLASLHFEYDGRSIGAGDAGKFIEQFDKGKLRRLQRDPHAEKLAIDRVYDTGLMLIEEVHPGFQTKGHEDDFCMEGVDDWLNFSLVELPKLRAAGWLIQTDPSFQFRLAEAEDWYTDAHAGNTNDWFGVELGVMLEGQKVNLLPVLLQLLKANPQRLSSSVLAQLPDDSLLPVPLPDGRTLPFPVGRARQILGVLLDLLDPDALDKRGHLKLSKLRAAELAGDTNWRWLGNTELRQMSDRLRSFQSIKQVAPSPRLAATLRPYQEEGLSWLQFLREYELAGVLADDMGLGKTVQALAHLLLEKESGRMDRPSLVVAPTSLMTNWRQEAERFTPDLRVLVLHGADRKQHFGRIAEHDLIITSYPLLPRDQTLLLEQQFHYVILDEAQFIKNPKTQYAQIACALKARHHLCLTGTPMENHLGELWSLFNFLLPGFLGDETRFNSIFRRPIEKGRNDERRQILAHRVRPFVLRRKKEEVVKELPPKTEIIQNVELGGAQRDLYESVRLAMHERVKAEVDSKGLSRSHIIILDALLKLRQICCHPQLLRIPAAQGIKESAKLELLLDLLPQMIDEGRRILLFSQFTSMLAIIETSLGHKKIPYVQLTGQTLDRATPVNRFQAGEVPLFLISLKAGGTGLNLTAADTVIHYDPWWNPAVENQATDRAHRIGQEKKVFVYKLMTVGTVEEKIAAMQARKRELVEGLLDAERSENLKLTPDDLDVLFAPIA